jgi:acetyl-CoA C-acetyltransferase
MTIVIAGAAQITRRTAPPSPVALTAEAVRAAVEDTGANVLPSVQALAVVDPFSWPVTDPGALLRDELGLPGTVHSLKSAIGGTGPVLLLGALAQRIAAGELDCAVLAGGEVVSTFMRTLRGGEDPGWPVNPEGTPAPETLGEDDPAGHPLELASGLIAPVMYYPLFEHALRAAHGRTVAEQQEIAGRLWARYAQVARDNPHAWTADPPADPGRVTDDNRMVAHPYPKYETANIQVDQAAALVVMSEAAADAAGVPRERRVHVHATATAHDHWFTGNRQELHRSPALRACAEAVALDTDAIAHLDLYSCFPSAVQVAGAELGIDPLTDAREPTVTGGLTFAGGPANNYVTHSMAAMVGRLRENPSDLGLCTAVGWYLTKHGVAVLGGPDAPAQDAVLGAHPQAQVDALPAREIADDGPHQATVETYTAMYDRDGSVTMGIVAGLLPDGRRTFGKTADGAALLDGDPIGRTAEFDGAGAVALL